MRLTLALTALDAVEAPHRGGHTCDDGKWYNDNTGTRTPCPIRGHLTTAREQVHRLHAQVHEAAHDEAAVEVIAQAMLSDTPMGDLDPDAAEGWRYLARLAVEGLAEWLDRDPVQEQRLAGIRERLAPRALG